MSTSDFTKYLEAFDRTAYGAGSSKGTDRYSGLDVRKNIDKGREFGLSDYEIGTGIQNYYNNLDDDVRRGGGTEDMMDRVAEMAASKPAAEPEAEEPTWDYDDLKFSPEIKNAIERVNSYRDRAWSGQTAQDIFGKSKSLANGIPASAGTTGTNKPKEAADLHAREKFIG